jgi:hypothetical protein
VEEAKNLREIKQAEHERRKRDTIGAIMEAVSLCAAHRCD